MGFECWLGYAEAGCGQTPRLAQGGRVDHVQHQGAEVLVIAVKPRGFQQQRRQARGEFARTDLGVGLVDRADAAQQRQMRTKPGRTEAGAQCIDAGLQPGSQCGVWKQPQRAFEHQGGSPDSLVSTGAAASPADSGPSPSRCCCRNNTTAF